MKVNGVNKMIMIEAVIVMSGRDKVTLATFRHWSWLSMLIRG